VGTVLKFKFVYEHGTGANHTITITNADKGAIYHSEVTNNTHILWNMGAPGDYRVTVVVDNGIGNDDADGNHPSKASGQVTIVPNGIIVLFDYLATMGSGEAMDFTLQFADGFSLVDICAKIRLGNEMFWYASAEHYCTDLKDPDYISTYHSVQIYDGSDTIRIVGHTFNKAGLTNVQATVTYAAASQHRQVGGFVNVTIYCLPPLLDVRPTYKLLQDFRSKRIHIAVDYFIMEFRCTATTEVHISFEIQKYTNFTIRELGGDVTNSVKSVIKADGLHVEPLQLQVGYYHVRMTLAMGRAGGLYAILNAKKTLDLRVQPTEITAAFTAGNYQMRGNRKQVKLNAMVTNRDDPTNTGGYTYKWFCHEDGVDDAWATTNVRLKSTAQVIDIPTTGKQHTLPACIWTGVGVKLLL
jgi:hypothetical protein